VADQPTRQVISAESSQAKRAENVQLTTYLPGLFVAQPTAIPPAQDVSNVEANSELSESLPEKLNPKKWKSWPVTPLISANAVEIYQLGVTNGNDPHAFSILGDCLSEPAILFERFADASYLENPEYKTYRKTLRYFSGSWDRYFITVANGMTVASAFSPAWAGNPLCQSGESPLDCEFRLHNPSILVISLGTNWGGRDPDEYENYLRKIVIYALDRNVLPVIATKGDPAGPNNPLNERMVKVAYEFDIPLWNFWAAIQEMPNQGLNPWDGLGGVHLSPEAWTVKRNTGLMALDVLRKAIQDEN
jgi:hypothetical protein